MPTAKISIPSLLTLLFCAQSRTIVGSRSKAEARSCLQMLLNTIAISRNSCNKPAWMSSAVSSRVFRGPEFLTGISATTGQVASISPR